MTSRSGGIGVISNPLSGRNRKNPGLMERLAYILGERGEMALPEGLDRLEAEIQIFRDRQIDVLCINGGDGTIHQVMTKLFRVYGDDPLPQIALLKGGTMNTIARNVGVRLPAEDMLGRVVARYHAGAPFSTQTHNLLVINEQRAGFIFGNGGIAHFLEEYYEGGNSSPIKAVRILARCVVSAILGTRYATDLFRYLTMKMTLDGEPLARDQYTMLGISTVADLGLGFRPFYRVEANPDRLQLVGIGCPPLQMAASLPRIRLAMPVLRDDVEDHIAAEIRLESSEPISYTIDGDMYSGEQTLRFRAGPRVRFIKF
ncbi:MAG: diacylglycerol kinase family protein [Myxococcota bacterium]